MNHKKIYAYFLSLLLSASLVTSSFASGPGERIPFDTGDVAGKLVILHTNDTHGRDIADKGILGTAAIAQLKMDYEAAGADTLLLSAGDVTQGTTLVNYSQGADAISFMNQAGYDAMCIGNHELDWGYDNLRSVLANAEFSILTANIIDRATEQTIFKERQIFTTKQGLKVGIFGLATPETATSTNPSGIQSIRFLGGQELYDCAQQQVDALKAEGCDLVIALGHLGVDESASGAGCRSVDVANHVTGIDLFVDGHSHTIMEQGAPKDASKYPSFHNNSNTLIVSTGCYLANAGVVIFDPASRTLTSSLISAGSYDGRNPAVNRSIIRKEIPIIAELGKPFARSETVLNGERSPGNRTQETNLGNFAADALLWGANQATGNLVDAAIVNGGDIRESIPVGDISMLDMKTVFPFNNQIYVLAVSGQELLEALEAATFCTPAATGAFPQVAGISFTLDTTKTYQNGAPYSTYFRCANPGARVRNVTIGGKPLDLKSTYYMAVSNFIAAGGDTYYAFQRAYHTNGFNTGVSAENALVNYTREVLNNTITTKQYGVPQGRIQIITAQ